MAIEKNQLDLLAQIDPELYDETCPVKKTHKRSASDSQPQMKFLTTKSEGSSKRANFISRSKTLNINNSDSKLNYSVRLRRSQSLPDICSAVIANRPRSRTVVTNRNSQPQQRNCLKSKLSDSKMVQQNYVSKVEKIPEEKPIKVPSFNYVSELKNSSNTIPEIVKCPIVPEEIQNIPIYYDYRYGPREPQPSSSTSASPSSSSPKTPNKSIFSIFESKKSKENLLDPNSSPIAYWDIFPNTKPGEKIQKTPVPIHTHSSDNLLSDDRLVERRLRKISTNYDVKDAIDSIQSTRIGGLDQENAHFELSEALIATMQQLKWNRKLNEKYKMLADAKSMKRNTIPETKHIILKNTLKMSTPTKRATEAKFTVGSASTDTDSNCSSEEFQNKEDKRNSIGADSIQEHSAQIEWDDANESRSAESIALLLISRFSDQQMNANQGNLKWLIKEGETSQNMLPMPDGFIVNPDDSYTLKTYIRGNKDWAPPRNQVIFTMHPPFE